MNRRIIILGTGTGVGKTWVAASLAAAARAPCLALKPIETGCSPIAPDAMALGAASCHPVSPLFTFEAPLTPWLAAEQEQRPLDLTRIPPWVARHENQHYTTCHVLSSIVETAGGVFSPLTANETNFHLARALEPATWLLVAPNSLGVLHHVAATLLALQHLGRPPDLVVLSQPDEPDSSSASNPRLLSRLHPSQTFIPMGYRDPATAHTIWQHLSAHGPA